MHSRFKTVMIAHEGDQFTISFKEKGRKDIESYTLPVRLRQGFEQASHQSTRWIHAPAPAVVNTVAADQQE